MQKTTARSRSDLRRFPYRSPLVPTVVTVRFSEAGGRFFHTARFVCGTVPVRSFFFPELPRKRGDGKSRKVLITPGFLSLCYPHNSKGSYCRQMDEISDSYLPGLSAILVFLGNGAGFVPYGPATKGCLDQNVNL